MKKTQEEVDGWYEEEKERLLDEYVKELEEGKPKDKAGADYTKKFNKLIADYNKQMGKAINQKTHDELHMKKMKRYKEHFLNELEKRLPKKWKKLLEHEEDQP